MSELQRFLQLHIFRSAHPSNPNRDDFDRPKGAFCGGTKRQRISSQCLKGAIRVSDIMYEAMFEGTCTRTRKIGVRIFDRLMKNGAPERTAISLARDIAVQISPLAVGKDTLTHKTINHFSPKELEAIDGFVDNLCGGSEIASELTDMQRKVVYGELMQRDAHAFDTAAFGRFVASSGKGDFSVEGAIQQTHAITVNESNTDHDFFAAVDDLNKASDTGSAYTGVTEFGDGGVFYYWVSINLPLLLENNNGKADYVLRCLKGLITAYLLTSPSGKQNSYGPISPAHYVLAETCSCLPLNYGMAAFNKAVKSRDLISAARDQFEYSESCWKDAYKEHFPQNEYRFDVYKKLGTLEGLLDFSSSAFNSVVRGSCK